MNFFKRIAIEGILICRCMSLSLPVYAGELFESLSPTLQQLFLDEAKKEIDEDIADGDTPNSLEQEIGWLLSAIDVVIPGKIEGENLTKLTTEDIDSLGNLKCNHVIFKGCDLTDVCFDGLFKNPFLIDISFSYCEPIDPEKLTNQLAREGWDWWWNMFHKMCIGLEHYR